MSWSIQTSEKIDSLKQLSQYLDVNGLSEIDWWTIFESFQVTENFIRTHIDKVSEYAWSCLSECQELSESFIEDFADKVDWSQICGCQKLSNQFIVKHIDQIIFNRLLANNKIDWIEMQNTGVDVIFKLTKDNDYDLDEY